MSQSYMEMIYIDSDNHARMTNVRAAMGSNSETWAAFQSAKKHEVEAENAQFLLDYYNRNGDLAETICLSARGFSHISGERVLTDAEYREIDRAFWKEQEAMVRAARGGAA